MNDWRAGLSTFSEFRDTVLFTFSTLYVLGYATWAFYSADFGLGVLPPIEGQYFLAGVIPLALFAMAYGTIRVARPIGSARQRERDRVWGEWGQAVSLILIVIGGTYARLGRGLSIALVTIGIVGVYVTLILQARSGERSIAWVRGMFFFAIPVLTIAASFVYATRFFPAIPAEFGGPKPVCVTLDLSAGSVAPETWTRLGTTPANATGAARMGPLWLHFNGGGVLVVSRQQGRPVPDIVRLQESIVTASTPSTDCDTRGTD